MSCLKTIQTVFPQTPITVSSLQGRIQLKTTKFTIADATHVCKLKADLNKLSLDVFEAKRSPGKMKIPIFKGQPYYEAEYDIKVIIGATDLKFELWFRNKQYGEKYLEVEWGRARVPDR